MDSDNTPTLCHSFRANRLIKIATCRTFERRATPGDWWQTLTQYWIRFRCLAFEVHTSQNPNYIFSTWINCYCSWRCAAAALGVLFLFLRQGSGTKVWLLTKQINRLPSDHSSFCYTLAAAYRSFQMASTLLGSWSVLRWNHNGKQLVSRGFRVLEEIYCESTIATVTRPINLIANS